MDELVAWYRQQLDDDEQLAMVSVRSCGPNWKVEIDYRGAEEIRATGGEVDGMMVVDDVDAGEYTAHHIARHDPAAVLADIEAKRAVLDLRDALTNRRAVFSEYEIRTSHTEAGIESYDHVIRTLARAYRHRPGWKTEWEA